MTDSTTESMRYLPIGLDVRNRRCVVVGGGAVGERKVTNLLKAGAAVTVVAPSVTQGIANRVLAGQAQWREESYQPNHLDGVFLLVAATDDQHLNAAIVKDATERSILVCDASSGERSQVIFGALHRSEDGITLAVFTDGRDPSIARQTRDRLAAKMHDNSNSKPSSTNS